VQFKIKHFDFFLLV